MAHDGRTLPDREALAVWLAGQRWFGAKSRRIRAVTVADAVPVGSAVIAILDVDLADGGRERYAVPLRTGARIADAFDDAPVCRALLALLGHGGTAAGEGGEIRGVPAAGLPAAWASRVPDDLDVRRLGGEQSNTSVALGEAVVLKLFRKLADGVNPEAEITRFLTERTAFRNAPRLVGHLEYRHGDTYSTLAVAESLVPAAVDGWQWVLGRLRDAPGADDTVTALARLGERIAELHRALASHAGEPAFAPEPIELADVAAWTAAVMAQLAAAGRALGGETVAVEPAAVRAGLAHLVGRTKIRHHGDFHLGQTLYRPADGDWTVIDFEGEPLRPLSERRRKHAAVRDVAGLLRSIDYAAVSALPADSPSARTWPAAAAHAFVEGYRRAAGAAPFLPATAEGLTEAIAVFEVEKAAYEIVYEADNRPDWVAIPRRGLLSAAARLRRAAAAGAA
jgi:trehalose synthase-fused probable maltokinase